MGHMRQIFPNGTHGGEKLEFRPNCHSRTGREDRKARGEQPNRGALRTVVEASLQGKLETITKTKSGGGNLKKSLKVYQHEARGTRIHHQTHLTSSVPSSAIITEIRHTGFGIGAPAQ